MKVIDTHLNGFGSVIVQAAKATSLSLSLACALVEQESEGRNIFGADYPNHKEDSPPYNRHDVTKERVQKLRDGGNYTKGMNGVGLTQLTWWEFVERAEKLGGAHIPLNQCLVGFGILADYLNRYPYMEAIASYNAGEKNRLSVINTYAKQVADKHEKWKGLLGMEYDWSLYGWYECQDNCNKLVKRSPSDKEGGGTWRKYGYYVLGKDGSAIYKAAPSFRWPVANISPRPNSTSYQERHPTRYTFRSDVGEWAKYLVQNYNVWVNTYWDHPETFWRDSDSFDVWGPAGRNDPLNQNVGDIIFNELFYDEGLPNIEWIIWRRVLYSAANNWNGIPWGSNSFEWHDDHIHVTYR